MAQAAASTGQHGILLLPHHRQPRAIATAAAAFARCHTPTAVPALRQPAVGIHLGRQAVGGVTFCWLEGRGIAVGAGAPLHTAGTRRVAAGVCRGALIPRRHHDHHASPAIGAAPLAGSHGPPLAGLLRSALAPPSLA